MKFRCHTPHTIVASSLMSLVALTGLWYQKRERDLFMGLYVAMNALIRER